MDGTTGEQGSIQLAINSITQKVAGLGLSLAIEQDFTQLRALLAAQGTFANPTYDPATSRLGPADFWVRLADQDGRFIACSAERLFEVDDFTALLAGGRLWYEHGFTDGTRLAVRPLSQRVGGRVGHSGSTWVHPDWRGAGLAMLLTWLTRALSFRNLGAAFNTGIVKESLYRTSVPGETYGYSHIELALDGHFPPLGATEKIYLCWIARAEFAARIATMPAHRRCPVPLRPAKSPALADLELALG